MLTTVLNAYRMSADKTSHVNDLLFTTIKYGKCVTGDTRILLADGSYKRIDELQDGATVVSFEGRAFVPMPAKWVEMGTKPIVKLTTHLGREIKTTWNHPYLTQNGWKKVSELKPGDKIAVPTDLPFFGDKHVPEEEAAFLGFWLAEGTGGARSPEVTTTKYGDKVQEWAEHFGCNAHRKGNDEKRAPTYALTRGLGLKGQPGNKAMDLLRRLGLSECRARDKHVPDEVFTWDRASIATFLHWFFNGDGWLADYRKYEHGAGFHLGFASSSERLVRDIAHLLLRFGIMGRIRRRPECSSWTWESNRYQEVRRFVDQIGIDRPMNELVPTHEPAHTRKLYGAIDYDKIDAIEEIGEEAVYDLVVPALHNFVAEDIIAHNTTMSELADQFGRLAGVAAPAGARLEEMTAAIATLTRQGIATDWSITSLRQTIMQLLRPGKELETVINDLGYASGRALIEHKGFAQAIKLVADYAEKNGIRMEQLFSNVRAVTAVLPLATTAASEYAKDLQRMANAAGAAEVAFKKQTQSWSYQLAKAKTYIQDVGISIGKVLTPALVGALKAFAAVLTPVREFADIFSNIGGDYFVAIAGGIATLTAGVWALTKAFGALSAAMSTSLTMGALGASNFGARLGGLLYQLGRGSMLAGAGLGLGGMLATSIAVKAAVDFDFALGNVTGIQGVVRALADTISMVAGGAVTGAIIGSLFPGVGTMAGMGLGAVAGATVALTILVIHEIRKGADAAAARMEAATQAVARARLPLEVGGITLKGGGLHGLAEQIVTADKSLENTAANIEAVQSVLEKYYVAETTWWGQIKGWHLKDSLVPMLRTLDDAYSALAGLQEPTKGATEEISNLDSSIAGLGKSSQLTLPSVSALSGTNQTGGLSFYPGGETAPQPDFLKAFTPTLLSDWKKAKQAWADLTATLNDNTKSAEEIAKAYEEMANKADFWESVADAIAKSFPELSAEIKAQVEDWKAQIGKGETPQINPVIKSAEDFRKTLTSLIEAFKGAEEGSLEQAIALQGLQQAYAQAKAYVATLTEEEIAANPKLQALIASIEDLGITSSGTVDAVEVFNNAMASLSATLSNMAAQIGATFSSLEQSILGAKTLGEQMAGVAALLSGAGNIKAYRENLERIINSANTEHPFSKEIIEWAKQEWERIKNAEPTPGKTYAEIQREQEQAAKKAAAAAKQAAREAAQAAKEAARAAQDAFKEMFNVPALAGIQKGSWEEAAKVIIGFAQNRNKLYDMAKALDAVNGKKLDEADVIDLIIGAQRQLVSSLDNQIKIMQFAGEDATALKEMKTRIEELFDPLGALKKKIREILGLSTTSPAIGGAQLRSLLLAIAKRGKIPKLATGGEVLTAGLAYLHPGETVTPATVNPLSGGTGMYSGMEGIVKSVVGEPSACASGLCAVAQEAQKGIASTAEAVNKTASSTCEKVKQAAQSTQVQQESLKGLGEKFQAALEGDAEALNELLKVAKPGGDEWKLLMQAYRDHISETENLIEDYKLLGLSTEELEKGLNEFRAAVQGLTADALKWKERWADVTKQITNLLMNKLKEGFYSFLQGIFGLGKAAVSLGSSLNVPTGYKVTRAAWKAAKPGEPGIEQGGAEGGAGDFWDSLLKILSDALVEWTIGDIVEKLVDWAITDIVSPIVEWFVDDIITPILDWVITDIVTPITDWVITNIVQPLVAGVNWVITDIVQPIADWTVDHIVKPLIAGVNWYIRDIVTPITNWAITNIVEPVKAGVNWFITDIVSPLAQSSWAKVLSSPDWDRILSGLTEATLIAGTVWLGITGGRELGGWLADLLGVNKDMKKILQNIGGILGGALVGALMGFLLGGHVGAWIGLAAGGIAGAIAGVASMQTGGRTETEGLAYLHPNELVIPAAQVEPLPPSVGSGGTIAIKNYLIVDGRVLAESVNRVSRDQDKRMTGSSIGGRSWRVA